MNKSSPISQEQYVFSVLIPVYNEEKAILETIKEIQSCLSDCKEKFEIIVINDGSTDKTTQLLEQNRAAFQYLKHQTNKGYGAALKTGLIHAKGAYIVIIDADSTYPNFEIPRLLQLCKSRDMVIGARTGTNVKIPIIRKPAKWFITWLANFISGEKIPDLNSGLRVFKRELGLEFFNLYPEGFSFTSTITLAALTNNYNVLFTPIDYFHRKGNSKINPIKDTFNFILLIFRIISLFHPLKIFLPISLFLFSIGLPLAFYQIIQTKFSSIGSAPILLLLSALQIGLLGLLADMIAKMYKRKF